MATAASSNTRTPGARKSTAKARTTNKSTGRSGNNGSTPRGKSTASRQNQSIPRVPTWVGVTASVVGAGLAAGYFAWRYYQQNGHWPDSFNAAFADGETDEENFDQTRNAGTSSMRSDIDDWEDIDDMSDASFPASDPPSFNPGTA
jgi:hypothetical protein